MNSEDSKKQYADIITLPYRKSLRHRPMPIINRAAAFAPFAALSGYDDMVREEARLTESRVELSEYEADQINRQLGMIADEIQNGIVPAVSVTYFQPDSRKDGGSYRTVNGKVRTVDTIGQRLLLYGSDDIDNKRISPIEILFSHLVSISEQEIP